MNITIIGCGNSGLIHAAKIFQQGNNRICLLKSSQSNNAFFDRISEEGHYRVVDMTDNGNEFVVKPDLVTRDARLAMEFADVVFVMTTTLQHEDVARLVAPYARNGQTFVLCPGYMGSFFFRKFISADVTYSEWETTAYNGRIINNEYVKITFYNPRNAVSVLPKSRENSTLTLLSSLFSNTQYLRRNILESAIHNPNMIVHTVGITMSAARIEYSKGEFWMYKEAFTPSIVNVINEFDKQKNEVLKAFGCEPLDYFEAAKWRNEEDLSIDAMESFRSFADCSNKGPGQLRHRYLMEDVPNGLGLFTSLGKLAGVNVSIAESIATLASALLQENFQERARTVQLLTGKPDITKEDLLKLII